MSLGDLVLDGEPIARYFFNSGHCKASGPRQNAFMPPEGATAISVSRTQDLSDEAVKELGQRTFPVARQPIGFGKSSARRIRSLTYDVEKHEPPERHAHVTGLPIEKAKKMHAADLLRQQFDEFVLYSEDST